MPIIYASNGEARFVPDKATAAKWIATKGYRREPPPSAQQQPIISESTPSIALIPPSTDALNVNTATLKQLTELPDIGVKRAKRIQENQGQYQVIEDLIAIENGVDWQAISHLIKFSD